MTGGIHSKSHKMPFRKIDVNFWLDVDLEDWSSDEKFFYLYLITTPFSNQIGIFEFSIAHASLHTGLNRDAIEKLLQQMEDFGKIVRSQTTREIAITKFYHHNKTSSFKLKKHCDDLFEKVKDKKLIHKLYGIDTVSIPDQQEQEQEQKEKTKTRTTRKKETAREIVFPYDTPDFLKAWENWKIYKKDEHGFKFKSAQSEQAQITQLSNLSETPEDAISIIMQSMSNGWKGLFSLKNKNTNENAKDTAKNILAKRGLL